ncbi:unnamed protein product, partial [Symbiodinium microadriaticum]
MAGFRLVEETAHEESSGSDSEGRARELQRQAAGHEETSGQSEKLRGDLSRRFRGKSNGAWKSVVCNGWPKLVRKRDAERRMLGVLHEGLQAIQGMVGRELGAELAPLRGRSQAPVRGRSQAPVRERSQAPVRGKSPAPATPSGAKGPTVVRCMTCDNCLYREKNPTSR